jgi:hypothetical protein
MIRPISEESFWPKAKQCLYRHCYGSLSTELTNNFRKLHDSETAVDLAEYSKKIGTDLRLKSSGGGETVLLSDQMSETLADLKPRMVLGYCSLRTNEFQRANVSGEDAYARGQLIREETDLKKYKIELKRRRQIGLTDRSSHRGNDILGSAH